MPSMTNKAPKKAKKTTPKGASVVADWEKIGMNKGALTKVRKCLLWTSTGNVFLDGLIEECCESAGTTPLPWGNLGVHLAYAQAVNLVVGKVVV